MRGGGWGAKEVIQRPSIHPSPTATATGRSSPSISGGATDHLRSIKAAQREREMSMSSSARLSEGGSSRGFETVRFDGEREFLTFALAGDKGLFLSLSLSLSPEKDIFNHARLGGREGGSRVSERGNNSTHAPTSQWISQVAVAVRNRLSIFELTSFSIAAKDARRLSFLPSLVFPD